MNDISRIKNKIIQLDSKRWWGDDFDVRFYLISQIQHYKNKKILDVGGGIGIILSEMNDSNLKINLDYSFDDLKQCKNNFKSIQNVCASMTHLPFRKNSFDLVIGANILEIAKEMDLQSENPKELKNSKRVVEEISFITNLVGKIFFTTPNNEYYNSIKLTFSELKKILEETFPLFKINFYNTYPRLSKKSRKLNLASILPKILSRFKEDYKIITSLCKIKSRKNYSVSFFVEIEKGR